jgi:hypothetical protein
VAIRQQTLRLLHQLTVTVGGEADQATRTMTAGWVRAWDELAPAWRETIAELVAKAAADGQWPPPWQLARMDRLASAVVATSNALDALAAKAGVTIAAGTGTIAAATVEAEPGLAASQLPAAAAQAATVAYAARLNPSALDVIVQRTTQQVTALTRPLSADATEAMRRSLIRGIAVGDNPRTAAADMLRRMEGDFNGGLGRAVNVARTEMLSAYRETSRYAHSANADVLAGWVWHASLGPRCCPSCWALNGTVHGLDEPGPQDHQQGRCSRLPKTKSWRELGFDLDEPPDLIPDARAKWFAMSRADQDALFGPARAEMVRSGQVEWGQLASRRSNPGWRDSYVPTSVRDLQRLADVR